MDIKRYAISAIIVLAHTGVGFPEQAFQNEFLSGGFDDDDGEKCNSYDYETDDGGDL